MTKQSQTELIKKLIETYGAKPQNWPEQHRLNLETVLKEKLAQQTEIETLLNEQLSIDLHLEQAKKVSETAFSQNELELACQNIINRLPLQKNSDHQANGMIDFFRSLLHKPLRAGLSFALVLMISLLVVNIQDSSHNKLPTIVENWLWSEVNPELLSSRSDNSHSDLSVLESEFGASEEEFL